MLFARSQGQAEPSLTSRVRGLPDQAARHAAHVFFPRGQEAHVRASVAERDTQRLRLSGHDVGLRGRAQDAERNRLRDHDNQQRSGRMSLGGRPGDILHGPKKIRRLQHHG